MDGGGGGQRRRGARGVQEICRTPGTRLTASRILLSAGSGSHWEWQPPGRWGVERGSGDIADIQYISSAGSGWLQFGRSVESWRVSPEPTNQSYERSSALLAGDRESSKQLALFENLEWGSLGHRCLQPVRLYTGGVRMLVCTPGSLYGSCLGDPPQCSGPRRGRSRPVKITTTVYLYHRALSVSSSIYIVYRV